jgi:AcrR family transcriptional regulator/DNA-directed RNA polymerase subunit RPC12/RpoP
MDLCSFTEAITHAIAARAQTAIGSLYQFFPDKLAIFHALEARHMERLRDIIAELLNPKMIQRPLEQWIRLMVETYARYFEHPIPRIVYMQYFVARDMFQLFDENFNRELIQTSANLFRKRNSSLSVEKSELLAEVVHRCYNTLLLTALHSDRDRCQQFYTEIGDLLFAYLKPHVGDEFLHKQVMKCPHCHSEKVSKNGHRHGKQRYICKDCGKQFPEIYTPGGYGDEIKQKCLELRDRGLSFREIERRTGISHNTIIGWVKPITE